MVSRSLLSVPVASMLLALAFAGCLGEEEAPAATDALASNESDLQEVTVDDGTAEMAAELGHAPHLHDYWHGKERVTIMDEDVQVDPFGALMWTFINTFRGTPGVGGAVFRLPEGSLVFEGTGKMEIVATWTDPTVTGAGLQYRSPATESFSDVMPLTSGTPLVLDIAPEMTDMPHDKESRWLFLLVPPSTGQAVVGTVHFRIDIVRMGDIALFPGHPELFGNEHTLTLYDGAAQSSTQSFPMRFVGAVTQNEAESGVRSAKVVPMETRSMTANVTITSTTSNIGTVSNVTFLYKPAGSFGYERAQTLSADPENGVFQFGWPVEMRETDSPYAKTSQWAFDLRIQTDPAGMGWETSGLADAKVDYQLTVVAYDSLLDGIEPAEDDDR
ncbi:MAG TPA: hypothetical protein VFH78_13050 [Candidatus Thermoplasmatota archaeon]|nr:hypothetical protein [Candidatus Thermoplasmatota archaeon]